MRSAASRPAAFGSRLLALRVFRSDARNRLSVEARGAVAPGVRFCGASFACLRKNASASCSALRGAAVMSPSIDWCSTPSRQALNTTGLM
jgi:hypothetical protein